MDAARLRISSLFDGLSDDDIARCATRFEEVELLAGSSLVKEGDFAYRFFVVLDGQVEVSLGFDSIRHLGPGDYFGEVGLLTGERRTARVVARTRCILATMMTWDFKEMLEEQPLLDERLRAVAEARHQGSSVPPPDSARR